MIKKPIVISMGEPSGIGTEILVKSWIERKKKKIAPFFVVDNFLRFKSIDSDYQYFCFASSLYNDKIILL